MKKRLGAVALLALVGCGGPLVDKTGRVGAIMPLAADAAAGATVYANTCASCHGPDGKGKTARAIASDVVSLSSEELATITLNGTGLMGPAGAALADQQVADLVGWMKANLQ